MASRQFIEQIKPKALQLCEQYGMLPSLMIAQACHESGFGKHAPGNNLFGYKWTASSGRDWQLLWTYEYINGQYVRIQAKFRKYNSFDESLEDYAKLIGTSKRYAPVRACKDYKCAAYQVKACGYATGHEYDKSIIRLIENYKLYELDYGDEMKPTEYLTPNFQYNEFFSGDVRKGARSIEPPSKYFADIQRMADDLQIVRDYIGSPIIITSAYRTPDWNRRVGGVKNSYHTQGIAVDVRVNGMAPYDLAVYIAKLTEFNGYGINIKKNFVHVDYRDKFMVFKY